MVAAKVPYGFDSPEIRIAIYSVAGGMLVVGLTTVACCLLCKRNITRFCCGRYFNIWLNRIVCPGNAVVTNLQ